MVVKTRDDLIYDVLKRWWYVLPEWPPKDTNYQQLLEEKNLREVKKIRWKIEDEIDKNNKRKVYQIPGYPGLFKNSNVISISIYNFLRKKQ